QNFNTNNRQNGYGRGNQRGQGGRGRGRSRGYGYGNGYGNGNFSNNRPVCQVCGKSGHSALACYQRFNKEFSGPTSSQNRGDNNNRQNGQNIPSPNAFMANQNCNSFIATPETVADSSWYADSGAANQVTADYNAIANPPEYEGKEAVIIGDGNKLHISYVGNSCLTDGNTKLNLENVLCVPDIAKNLVSVSKLARDNHVYVEFHDNFCLVKDKGTGQVLLKGVLNDGLYKFHTAKAASVDVSRSANWSREKLGVNNADKSLFVLSNSVNVVSKGVWHRRLGHPSLKVFESLLKTCNLPTKVNEKIPFCDACQFGKAHALPFPNSTSRTSAKFELIHTDLWGPAPLSSIQGFKYYVLFLDDFSRYVWIYPLKQKNDTLAAFNHFVALVRTQFDSNIKALQTDNGGEFAPIHRLCESMGVQLRLTCPHTSQQNGRAERKHRHVVETALTLLAQASMPLKYWWDAFLTATLLITGIPSQTGL
ncbi:MAG: DDE-type integrase/transposase/recombinase, partial [Sweet potato little leaf phytoplasma]|nr:DDE-type integrase/transposase/recombinase [Sweet potato little leaf phytoplasma]